ncbi:MAG TPA: single-stranded DNA-binding protein, partial [Pseudolysinimonas sp.]|nr:single-stranded DNA-binding protein [Pseudolysinimonas sp.]
LVTGDGLSITSFRLASNQRRYDRAQQKWVDGITNWYTVTTFRQLATNVIASVHKGQRIVVTGRLKVRDWSTDDKKGTSIELDAEALGHDLSWGTATFTRSAAAAVAEEDELATGEAAAIEPQGEAGGGAGAEAGGEAGVVPEQETVATPF